MKTWHLAALVVAAGLPGPAAVLAAAAPVSGAPMLVLLSPRADADALLARAGARQIAPVRAPFAVLATSDRPDAAAALLAAGAWAVRDAGPLSALCTGQS